MPNDQTALSESKIVFTSGNEAFTVRDLVDAATFRGEIEPIWKELLRIVAAEKKADERELEFDDEAIDAAAEKFRYDHDLITAEETEQWLEAHGLTVSDFTDFFVRHYWGRALDDVETEAIDLSSAPEELRELLTAELIFSGELDRLATRLSWRVAGLRAAAENAPDPQSIVTEQDRFLQRAGIDEAQLPDWLSRLGRDAAWFRTALAMEIIHRQKCETLLNKQACEHEVAALRLPLTRFDLETVEFDSLDAAREALLCVREDGMSMNEVATEGRYPYRRADVLLEDLPPDLQQKFLSVSAGEILEPIARGEGFHLCRVVEKMEPKVDDTTVRDRAEKRILERHFEDLSAKHIQWPTVLNPAE